jgi:hypothetical protein
MLDRTSPEFTWISWRILCLHREQKSAASFSCRIVHLYISVTLYVELYLANFLVGGSEMEGWVNDHREILIYLQWTCSVVMLGMLFGGCGEQCCRHWWMMTSAVTAISSAACLDRAECYFDVYGAVNEFSCTKYSLNLDVYCCTMQIKTFMWMVCMNWHSVLLVWPNNYIQEYVLHNVVQEISSVILCNFLILLAFSLWNLLRIYS